MLFSILLFSLSTKAQTLSMTVGRVAHHIITSRAVNIQALIEKALYQTVKAEGLRLNPLDSKAFFNEVHDTILERALASEAKSFDVVQLEEKEVNDMEAKVSKSLMNTHAWKSLEPQSSEWKGVLEQKMKAKQFV